MNQSLKGTSGLLEKGADWLANRIAKPETTENTALPIVFFATLILLATLLYLWKTRARLCKFCHPFYQSLWHFLPVQVFSGEMTPAILQSCSTTLGLGLLRGSASAAKSQPR
jgi:hypothetical protein